MGATPAAQVDEVGVKRYHVHHTGTEAGGAARTEVLTHMAEGARLGYGERGDRRGSRVDFVRAEASARDNAYYKRVHEIHIGTHRLY